MRLLHTSDWHIGRFLNSYSLIEDQVHFLNWLINLIKEEKVDVLIVAGDIYNTASPSASCVAVLDEFFSKVVLELKKKVLIVAGNHDSPEKLGFSSKMLEKSGFYIATTLDDVRTIKFFEENFSVAITLLPFVTPAMVKEKQDLKISSFNETIQFVLKKYMKNSLVGDFNLICAHGLFLGSKQNELKTCDSEIEIGGCDVCDLGLFKDYSYVALGHLHSFQQVFDNAFYSGSPIKYSVSEHSHKKRVILLEVLKGLDVIVKKINVDCLRDLVVKKGMFSEIMKQKSDDFVAIKLLDDEFIIDPYSRLKKNYPNILEIEFLNLTLKTVQGFKVCKNKNETELFKDFFKVVSGREINSVELRFFEETLKKVKLDEEKK